MVDAGCAGRSNAFSPRMLTHPPRKHDRNSSARMARMLGMLRSPLVLLASGLLLAFSGPLTADPAPAPSSKLDEALAVQRAMEQAKFNLFEGRSKQAVDCLEEQLSRADGNARFLKLLRDAY